MTRNDIARMDDDGNYLTIEDAALLADERKHDDNLEARCTIVAHEEDGEPIFASERAGGLSDARGGVYGH